MDKFQGKWIQELKSLIDNEDVWEFVEPKLDRIDVFLQLAASETDNEFLHDDIMRLLNGDKQ